MIGVLLVDDDQLIRAGIRLILEAEDDIEVVGEASTGREAIEQARRLRPTVVLMDVEMPGMDGREATRRARAAGVETPILGVTAHVSHQQYQASIDAVVTLKRYVLTELHDQELASMLARFQKLIRAMDVATLNALVADVEQRLAG